MFAIFEKLFSQKAEITPYMNEVIIAAQEGNPEAQYCLGTHYKYGTEGFRKNGAQAMEWLHKAADQEYIPAYAALAHSYLEGNICKQSNKLFVEWGSRYLLSAPYSHNTTDPIMNGFAKQIGYIYMKGDGVDQDFMQAMNWLITPADVGDEEAQYWLGLVFYKEAWEYSSYSEAFRWFARSAEKGYMDAQRALGLCYLLGEGVAADMNAAKYWFTKAAEQGDEHALLALHKYCRE